VAKKFSNQLVNLLGVRPEGAARNRNHAPELPCDRGLARIPSALPISAAFVEDDYRHPVFEAATTNPDLAESVGNRDAIQ